MGKLVRWETDQGPVVVELSANEPGFVGVSRIDDVLFEAKGRLEDAMRGVRAAAQTALLGLREGMDRPDQIELEFGVKFNAAAGAVIAKTSMEGQMKVKLTWGAPVQQVEVETGSGAGATGNEAGNGA
ncbi:CU044_2847 family protein [Actinomadura kijaniata]|uniref:CU044_2847 family protein n=1 Tax=Actinomadura kijaniata TaxID=46161 RepID=UPI00082DBD29|nr:CU044_2847 family protein [Actinomadura kijaniata]